MSEAAEGTTEHERLKAVASTTDGFALAERDFELRREGDVLGLAQSGLPRLRVATLANATHRELAARARVHAERLIGEDGEAPGRSRARPRARRRLAAARVRGRPGERGVAAWRTPAG